MQFQELTDKQWDMIKPHIPKPAKTGRPRDDDRRIINGITCVLISGCRWSEMPTEYGDDSTANRRLNSWQQKGIWRKILSGLIKTAPTDKTKPACKRHLLTPRESLPKKGQHNRT